MSDFSQQIVAVIPHLNRYALKIAGSPDEAEDLVQDCVERALRKSDLYRPGTNLRAWMFTMMRNLFINRKRREKVSQRYTETVRVESSQVTAPTQVTQVFLNQAVSALGALGPEEREAVRLLGIEERSHREAADAMDLPVGTMKSRLFRARAKLRGSLVLDGAGVFGAGNELDAA
jgi:RNA polymerase sigma-70 factor (ECF subfamily)